MDVLLKQDVDLGFSLILPDVGSTTTAAVAAKIAAGKQAVQSKKATSSGGGAAIDDTEDDIQKWNALLEIKSDEV